MTNAKGMDPRRYPHIKIMMSVTIFIPLSLLSYHNQHQTFEENVGFTYNLYLYERMIPCQNNNIMKIVS